MTYTITSKTTISYNSNLHDALLASNAIFEMAETKTSIIYRRMNLPHNDNLSGDIEKSDYLDYTIDVIVMPLLLDDRILQQGEMKPRDVELFIKPYINQESSGTIITIPFVPQLDDEFWFNGNRYRIKLIRKERIGNTIIYLDCLCSRLENSNPTTEWNENYRQPIDGSRRGSGWD